MSLKIDTLKYKKTFSLVLFIEYLYVNLKDLKKFVNLKARLDLFI